MTFYAQIQAISLHLSRAMGSPHDGETSNAGGLDLDAKLGPYPSTGPNATTQCVEAWFIQSFNDAGFVTTNPVTTRGLQVVGA